MESSGQYNFFLSLLFFNKMSVYEAFSEIYSARLIRNAFHHFADVRCIIKVGSRIGNLWIYRTCNRKVAIMSSDWNINTILFSHSYFNHEPWKLVLFLLPFVAFIISVPASHTLTKYFYRSEMNLSG